MTSQLRVLGGVDYVNFVDKLLNVNMARADKAPSQNNYDLKLFKSLRKMISSLKKREEEGGLARLVAGYSWEWRSKKHKQRIDIEIEGLKLRWNSTNSDWINSNNAINEVGCIHTTQGYDLNFVGVIFGHEITYDPKVDEIVIKKENYYDRNGKVSIQDPNVLKSYIINIYKTLMLRGIRGTYIYVCDDNLREYFAKSLKVD